MAQRPLSSQRERERVLLSSSQQEPAPEPPTQPAPSAAPSSGSSGIWSWVRCVTGGGAGSCCTSLKAGEGQEVRLLDVVAGASVDSEGKPNVLSLSSGKKSSVDEFLLGGAAAGKGIARAVSPSPGVGKDSRASQYRQLIRNFARHAVGPGYPVVVRYPRPNGEDGPVVVDDPENRELRTLRMNRQLSQIEIWPPSTGRDDVEETSTMNAAFPLKLVDNFEKHSDSRTLTFRTQLFPLVELCFEGPDVRNKAYTCFKIFQMSIPVEVRDKAHSTTWW